MTDDPQPAPDTASRPEVTAEPCEDSNPAAVGEPITGNYFVSAYPPFFYWSETEAPAVLAAVQEPPTGQVTGATRPLGLYIHIPFCVQRCNYCYYLSYEGRGDAMGPYCDALAQELTSWMTRPALRHRRPDYIYFGGGTPSILSTAQVRRLLHRLKEAGPWQDDAEVTFECAPRTLTEEKIAALRAGGVNRLSMGVQQMDDEVLRTNGRVHLVADVERAYGLIRKAGFKQINIDLMVGMPGETEAGFMASLARVVDLAPDSITIYQTEVPRNTRLYKSIEEGDQDLAELDWEMKHRRLDQAFHHLEDSGYTRRSAYTAVRDPRTVHFAYQDLQYQGADLLGLGTSSFSYLGGIHHQNVVGLESYVEKVERGDLPVWRGHVLDESEQQVREFVLQLKLGRVDLNTLRRRHGSHATDGFQPTLEAHAARGWLTFSEDEVVLTRDGLTRVDRFLRDYFLPRHRGPRYS
jgi:oxygen-independent coproporphyrinogen-3 oxidase